MHHRRLPHCHPANTSLFITFRLVDSLPRNRFFHPDATPGQAFVAMDRLLDTAHGGPRWLGQPEVAEAVVASLRKGEELGQHELEAFVVMPNHVHVLMLPRVSVSKLMQSLKSATAKEANRLLGRTGRFWQDEYYDHWVRNEEERGRIVEYIEMNPVRAGLCG